MADQYHHGNLRRAILDRAAAIIADDGVEALSLRAVAAELNVSHAAPRHHFANREALLTAIAAEGFTELGDRLARVRASGGDFLATGVAYVRFALDHPAHFAVMFTPTLVNQADPELDASSGRALALLQQGAIEHHDDPEAAAIAGWSLVHGFSALTLSGALTQAGFVTADLPALAERAASLLQPNRDQAPAHPQEEAQPPEETHPQEQP